MPQIHFTNGRAPISVELGETLMKALQKNGVPVASSCGGEGVCLSCIIEIVNGKENLSSETPFEKDLREIHDIPRSERISCQTKILGDVTLNTPYW